jgi:hypothetical protein
MRSSSIGCMSAPVRSHLCLAGIQKLMWYIQQKKHEYPDIEYLTHIPTEEYVSRTNGKIVKTRPTGIWQQ